MTGTSKERDLNFGGLRQATGKIDDAFKYFFAKMSSYDCAVKVKREIKDVSHYQTILSEELCPLNQHLIYFLFIGRIKKELHSQPTLVKCKLKHIFIICHFFLTMPQTFISSPF